MRSHWPVSSRDSGRFVLIAALSGRALAAAARQAGYQPLVADLFGDVDTQAIAAANERVPGSLARGPARKPLLEALDRLADGRAPAGLVYGSGFERRTALLHAFARRHTLLGNSPDVVARTADPIAFSELCRSLDVPHPAIRYTAAPDENWLEKRAGGAGGGHIRMARPGVAPRRRHYLQRRAEGRPISALFLADGRRSLALGFSEQWADPRRGRPFRYGGAVRPATLAAADASAMAEVIERVVPAIGLVGLNSADFLLRGEGFDLLEINPRPGASLDVFSDAGGTLFHLHVQACRGWLPEEPPTFTAATAAAIVYVPRACALPEGFAWPDWAADRQAPGIVVPAGGPLCTVRAHADDATTARMLVQKRIAAMQRLARIVE
jgi:predicted ATP-grasp superfamily ATP-dependent carboligase